VAFDSTLDQIYSAALISDQDNVARLKIPCSDLIHQHSPSMPHAAATHDHSREITNLSFLTAVPSR
jgi:hypothetical protein